MVGFVWIGREKRGAEAEAVQAALRTLKALRVEFEEALPFGTSWIGDPLVVSGAQPPEFLYGDPPEPTSAVSAFEQFQQALSHPGVSVALAGLDVGDARTPAGLPLAPLVAYERARRATGEGEREVLVAEMLELAVGQAPSVVTPKLLGYAEEWGVEVNPWQSRWNRDEELRAFLRWHWERVVTTTGASWIQWRGQPWFLEVRTVVGRPGVRRVICAHRDELTRAVERASARVEGLLPTSWNLASALAGRHLAGPAPGDPGAPEILASVGERVRLSAVVPDSGGFQAGVASQQRILIFTVAGSLIVGFVAFGQSLRAFRRQVALGKAKSNFISSVSHELRTPVASLSLLTERLADGNVTGEDKRAEYYAFLRQECRRLATLIQNVLDVSQIEQGSKHYSFDEIDLGALVRDAVRVMEPAAAAKQVRLELEISSAEIPVEADALQLQQAVVNLIDNAVKYSPQGGRVQVSVNGRGRAACVEVGDGGAGIDRHEQGKIFERFYRSGSEMNRETVGAGIGLNLVRHCMEAHGGRVEVESAPGEGSRFSLVFPRDGEENSSSHHGPTT